MALDIAGAREAAKAAGYAAVLTYGGPVQIDGWLATVEPRDWKHYRLGVEYSERAGRHYITHSDPAPQGLYNPVWPLLRTDEFVGFASKPSDSEAAMARQAAEG